MADINNWKSNERAFAKFFSDKLGIKVRRNDATHNAGDPERNSDVDVVDECLQVLKKIPEAISYRGITGELKYSKTGFKTLYKWLRWNKDSKRPSIIVINGTHFVFWLKDFFPVYSWLIQYKPHTSPAAAILYYTVNHMAIKTQFKFLTEGLAQCRKYAHHRGLFPILCMRGGGERQIVAIGLEDIRTLTLRTRTSQPSKETQ